MAEVNGIASVGIALAEDVTGNYTLQYGDLGKILNVTTTATITIPSNLPAGWNCLVMVDGGGTATIAAGAGVTLLDPASRASLTGNGAAASLYLRTASEAILF